MAGRSFIMSLLICLAFNLSWSQDTLVQVIHTLFNHNEGTIDVICQIDDDDWVQNFTFNKERLLVDFQGHAENDVHSMSVQKVVPLRYYGADFQPEPVSHSQIAILYDRSTCLQSGAATQATRTLERLMNSKILGYSPVTLFTFDTICQQILPNFEDYPISDIKDLISIQNDSCLSPHWGFALKNLELDKFDLFIFLTNGSLPRLEGDVGADSARMSFIINHISPDKSIFPIGLGNHIDTTFFEDLINFTHADDAWTSGGKIPISIAQATNSSDEGGAQIVIQCLPDAVNEMDKWAFSFSPKKITVSFDGQNIAHSLINPGTFLRPTILNQKHSEFGGFLSIIFFAALFLAALMLILPMRYRYIFKRDYVKVYQDSGGNESEIDPVTLVPIEKGEMIVQFGERAMTLETWKSIKGDAAHPVVKRYAEFFDPKYTGYFFSFKAKGFHPVLTAWYGLTGGTIAWAIHELMYVQPFNFMHEIQKLFINAGAGFWGIHFPQAFWTSICLTIGIIGVSVILRYRRFSSTKLPLLTFVFLIAAYFFSIAMINQMSFGNFVDGAIFWILAGIVFAFSYAIAFDESIVKFIPDAIILAIGGFLFFQMISHFLLIQTLRVDLRFANLTAFALFGWLYAQLSVREPIMHEMAHKNGMSLDHEENSESLISHSQEELVS